MQVRKEIEKLTEDELLEMFRNEFLRKLARYKLIDESLRKKYGMGFEEFERQNIVAVNNYSWEVESDAQEWESAIDGIATCSRKLKELEVWT